MVQTADEHRRSLAKIAKVESPSQQLELEAKCGVRYSELCRLPYLNIIRHHVIDPMHNMYLGSSKNMIKIWKEIEILKPEHFDLIQVRLDKMNIPHGIGRVPHKIHSKVAGPTADQWRN